MFCPECGLEVNNDTTVCPACGHQFNSTNTQADTATTENNSQFNQPADTYTQQNTEPVNPTYPNPIPPAQYQAEPEKPIPNFLVWSILCTIFCCLPCGIVGIVYSSKVNTLILQRKFNEAKVASSNAKIWDLIGTIVGAACIICVAILFALGIFVLGQSGNSSGYSGYYYY